MKTKNNDIVMDNKIFLWIAVATAALLSIPFMAMQFNWQVIDPGSGMDGVNWTLFDFIVMGTLIFGISFLFVTVARVTPRKHRMLIAIGSVLLFLWIWVELAVGLFTNWGS